MNCSCTLQLVLACWAAVEDVATGSGLDVPTGIVELLLASIIALVPSSPSPWLGALSWPRVCMARSAALAGKKLLEMLASQIPSLQNRTDMAVWDQRFPYAEEDQQT
jgi:hypothetical protein